MKVGAYALQQTVLWPQDHTSKLTMVLSVYTTPSTDQVGSVSSLHVFSTLIHD